MMGRPGELADCAAAPAEGAHTACIAAAEGVIARIVMSAGGLAQQGGKAEEGGRSCGSDGGGLPAQ